MRKIVLASLAISMIAVASAWAGSAPAVVSGAATGVTETGAVVRGTVNPEASTTAYSFAYGPTAAYGLTSTAASAGKGTKAVSIQTPLSGLDPGTVYHYRIQATNSLGTSVGADRTFTTAGHPPPGVATGAALGVGKTTVTLTGLVASQSETTDWYFQYGTTTAYGLQTAGADATASTAATPVSYTIAGLSPGTTFHYRLVADHGGTVVDDGADQVFTTIPQVPLRSRVTAHTTPGRARHKPYLFTTIGKVLPPPSLPAGVGCTGLVTVRFLLGHRSVAVRRLALQPSCTFSAQVRFRHLIDHTRTLIEVEVLFGGNAYLRHVGARRQRIGLG